MNRMLFPDQSELKREQTAAQQAGTKRKEEERAYINEILDGMPRFSMAYVDDSATMLGMPKAFWVAVAVKLLNKNQDAANQKPMNNLLIKAMAWLMRGEMKRNRFKEIRNINKRLGNGEVYDRKQLSDTHYAGMHGTLIAHKKLDNAYNMLADNVDKNSFFDISRCVLKNRAMYDSAYFLATIDAISDMNECIYKNPLFFQTIIEGYLDKNPEKIDKLLSAIKGQPLPASIQKYAQKSR